MRIAIIGAGMAGLSCADRLIADGHDVTLFDKGRGPGGRMSTRRIDTPVGPVFFDHGAQYLTARDPGFCAQVAAWEEAGTVKPWPAAELLPKQVWVGAPAMNSVIKAMAVGKTVNWAERVIRLEKPANGWRIVTADGFAEGFDCVVLALPAEQAIPFLALNDFEMLRQAMLARSLPCWTGMFVFDNCPGDQNIVQDEGIITWAVRNNARPGRSGLNGWLVQADSRWSQANLEAPAADVAVALLGALSDVLGATLPEPIAATAHRWRYALSAGLGVGAMWNADLGLGVCGDWLLGPRIECAWMSGQDLAARIVAAPNKIAA